MARSRKYSTEQGAGLHWYRPKWADGWKGTHAWFLEITSGYDEVTLEEMPELKEKFGVPLQHDEAEAILKKVNQRSNQLQTQAKRAAKASKTTAS